VRWAVAVILLRASTALAQDSASARLERTFAAIDDALKSLPPIPGFVLGITDRNHTLRVFTHGYSDLRARTPITESSLFEIGSLSKSFTAVALMQLFDEGRFNPRAPISTYLPWFTMRSKYPPVTGHHLLSHTSGLPSYRPDLASAAYATYALREFEPSYAPGAHYWYSNTGFQTLGYALEAIEDTVYHTIIERRVFGPLHMSSSVAAITDAIRERLPTSYSRDGCDTSYAEQPWFEYFAGDGSVASTVEDILAYDRMLLNRGVGPNGRMLSERAFTMLTTPVLEKYAYGLRARSDSGDLLIGHGGLIAGFVSDMVANMDTGFGIVFLANALIDQDFELWVMHSVRAAIRGKPLPVRASPQPTARTLSQFAGTFAAAGGHTVEFTTDDRGLVLSRDGKTFALRRIGPRLFCSTDPAMAAFPFAFEQRGDTTIAVSHGPEWFASGRGEPRSVKTPPAYLAFVGRYENHNPEGLPLRVFIRRGELYAADGFSEGARLIKVGESLFRPAAPAFNPERYQFGAVVAGHALRVLVSGMPMYRVDDR